MNTAIILIVLLAIGFLVAVRIVGINKGEKNPEENTEDEVVLSEEEKSKISIKRCYVFYIDTGDLPSNKAKVVVKKVRKAHKNGKLDFDNDFVRIEDDVDDILIFPISKEHCLKDEDCQEDDEKGKN
jgi:hypothetical protein